MAKMTFYVYMTPETMKSKEDDAMITWPESIKIQKEKFRPKSSLSGNVAKSEKQTFQTIESLSSGFKSSSFFHTNVHSINFYLRCIANLVSYYVTLGSSKKLPLVPLDCNLYFFQ